MNKTLLSLALAGTFAAGLALAGAASAHFVKSDLSYQNASQPSLLLARGGGFDKQDPFKELREERRKQQQQSRTDGTQNSKSDNSGEKKKQDEESKSGGFFGLFDS